MTMTLERPIAASEVRAEIGRERERQARIAGRLEEIRHTALPGARAAQLEAGLTGQGIAPAGSAVRELEDEASTLSLASEQIAARIAQLERDEHRAAAAERIASLAAEAEKLAESTPDAFRKAVEARAAFTEAVKVVVAQGAAIAAAGTEVKVLTARYGLDAPDMPVAPPFGREEESALGLYGVLDNELCERVEMARRRTGMADDVWRAWLNLSAADGRGDGEAVELARDEFERAYQRLLAAAEAV